MPENCQRAGVETHDLNLNGISQTTSCIIPPRATDAKNSASRDNDVALPRRLSWNVRGPREWAGNSWIDLELALFERRFLQLRRNDTLDRENSGTPCRRCRRWSLQTLDPVSRRITSWDTARGIGRTCLTALTCVNGTLTKTIV